MPIVARRRTSAALAVVFFSVFAFRVAAQDVYRIGGGTSAPTLIHKVEPEYADEARAAKLEGTVVVYIVVDEEGIPRDLKVVRPLGMGLDEKAIEAVRQWRFEPGVTDWKRVKVAATVEINFRLPDDDVEANVQP